MSEVIPVHIRSIQLTNSFKEVLTDKNKNSYRKIAIKEFAVAKPTTHKKKRNPDFQKESHFKQKGELQLSINGKSRRKRRNEEIMVPETTNFHIFWHNCKFCQLFRIFCSFHYSTILL